MNCRLILSLLVWCAGTSAFAQRPCRVFGTVRDSEGQPIALACAANDSVTVVCSMLGYETRKHTLLLPKDSVRLDVVLPLYTASFGEAVVKSQRRQTTATQQLNPGLAKGAPSATGNAVEEMVTAQAGVSTHSELSSQYNVRGGSFDENVVYLNGIELYRPQLVRSGQQEGLSVINSAMVEGIKFSSGGFEAKYGDKMSSVLDITYRRPEQWERFDAGRWPLCGVGKQTFFGDDLCSLQDHALPFGNPRHGRRISTGLFRLPVGDVLAPIEAVFARRVGQCVGQSI